MDRPPVRPAWSGSLGSFVALELVPEKTVGTPLINEIGSRLVKLSREGGEPATEILNSAISLVIAPSLFAPFFRHWYCKPTPDAVTLSDTLAPSVTLVLCGCELMTGIPTTVSVATMLVADPNG